MDNFGPALPAFALGSTQFFLTHAPGMKGLSCCPYFTNPFPSHLSVHQESFSTDPSTVRAGLDGFITVILFVLTISYLFDLQAVHCSDMEYSSSLTCWSCEIHCTDTWDAAAGLFKGREMILRKNFSPLYPLIKMLWNEDIFLSPGWGERAPE